MRVLLIALVLSTGIAHADLRFAIHNDTFTGLVPPFDDDGFTNDVDIRFWRPRGDYLVGVSLLDRWVTERFGRRRMDLLELTGTVERTHDWLMARARAGFAFTGNLGGRWGQNAFHYVCRCGRLLPPDGPLQDTYPSGNDVGLLAGVLAKATTPTPHARGYAIVDTQVSLGAGTTYLDAGAGIEAIGHVRGVELGAHVEAAVARYHVSDDAFLIPGGYRTGWHTQWRAGVHVAWSRYHLEYEYRANESNSGEPVGVIAFTIEYRP